MNVSRVTSAGILRPSALHVVDHGWSEVEPVTGKRVHVLDLDHEVAGQIPPREFDAARAAALVAVQDLPTGPWQPNPRTGPVGGLLVVHGCLAREVSVLG